MMVNKACSCKKWQVNAPIIDGAVVFVAQRYGNKGLENRFNFCPWCGNALVEEEEENE